MFSLVSPFALWLAPLVALPLAIALMGRHKPKTRDFPSLLPVRATVQNAMRRHRVKNRLQLILRTLALLCLLLAAVGPVWRGRSPLPLPAVAGLFVNNGPYAGVPLEPRSHNAENGSATVGERQFARLNGLDSLASAASGKFLSESLFPDAGEGGVSGAAGLTSGSKGVGRYGRSTEAAEALARLFARLGEAAAPGAPAHAWVPVFAARDLPLIAAAARPWLEANPGARLIVDDQSAAAGRVTAFGAPRFALGDGEGQSTGAGERDGALTIRAPLNEAGLTTLTPSLAARPTWSPRAGTGWGPARTARREDGHARVTVPLPATSRADDATSGWVAGSFALAPEDPARGRFAFVEQAVSVRVPSPATLCHYGSREAYVSLASLGEGGERLKVVSLTSATSQPSGERGGVGEGGVGERGEGCALLYLADPPDADAALAARAVAILRRGGTVFLETGPRTNAVLWNRAVLGPLDAGLLTDLVTEPAGVPRAAVARYATLAGLGPSGARAQRWGQPGTVTTRFGFRPSPRARVLLAHETETGAPLWVERRIEGGAGGRAGRLLIWTTSLSTPSWSTIGLGPWAALAHQAAVEGTWSSGLESRTVDADSLACVPSAPEGVGEEETPRVTDPRGEAFTRVRAEAGGWLIGPFDAPGLHRVESRGADSWLAVTVAAPPPMPHAADWKAFETALGPTAWSRTVVRASGLSPGDDWRTLYGGVPLRLALLALAALLLFAEGVVSLRLAHASHRETSSPPS